MAHRTPLVLILIMSCYITFVGDRISQSATLFNAVDGFLQKRKINKQLFPKFTEVCSCRLAGSFLLLICHQLKKVCGGEENKDFRYASDVLLFWLDLRTRRKSFTEKHHSNILVFSGVFLNKKANLVSVVYSCCIVFLFSVLSTLFLSLICVSCKYLPTGIV